MSDSPYPGLRAFEQSESHLFFGRQQALSDMVEKLRKRRFLAVTGPSGCGKSSLLKAGLLEELDSGFLSGEKPWRIVLLRPGNRPLRALAQALATSYNVNPDRPELLEVRLAGDDDALADWLDFIGAENETLFLIVDQFEEIFRFEDSESGQANSSQREDAQQFVDVLLRASQNSDRQIFVITTMRIDFLGDCATIPGLIEAINESHFLTPRMTRLQCAEAIREPARVMGGEVDPALVTEMLNDLSLADGEPGAAEWTNPDLLPLLQNVLARMWRQATGKNQNAAKLTITHYNNVGRLSGALNSALDSIYDALSPNDRKLAERIFKLLVQPESTHRRRDVRRPTSLSDIVMATASDIASVTRVIDAFRAEGRNFLMPPPSVRLTGEQVVDISHESLIRQWERLRTWVREEQRSAELYRQLETSARQAADSTGPDALNDRQLAIYEPWWEETAPTAVWAQRYGTYHAEAFAFYRASVEARDRREAEKRRKIAQDALKQQRWQEAVRQLAPIAAALTASVVLAAGAIWYGADRSAKISESVAAADRATQLVLAGSPLEALETIRTVLPSSLGGTRFLWPYEPRVEAALYLTLDALRSQWVLQGHRGAVHDVDIAEPAQLMASASADGFAYLWNLRTSRREGAWAHPELTPVVSIALSAATVRDNAHWIVSIDEARVARVWSTGSESAIAQLGDASAQAAAFSPDGARVYILRTDGAVDVYNTAGIDVGAGAAAPVAQLDFIPLPARAEIGQRNAGDWRISVTPDARGSAGASEAVFVATPSGAGVMRVLTADRPTKDTELRFGGGGAADISPNGATAVLAQSQGVEIFDLATSRRRILPIEGRPSAVTFSPDSESLVIVVGGNMQIATLSDDTLVDLVVRAGDAAPSTLATTRAGPSGSSEGSEGWSIVIGEQSGALGLYSADLAVRPIADLGDGDITATALSENGRFAVIASAQATDGHTMRVIDTSTGAVVRRMTGHTGGWRITEFSRDGRRVTTVAPNQRVAVLNAATGQTLSEFTPDGEVLGIAEGVDGAVLVAFRPNGATTPTVNLVELNGSSVVASLPPLQGDFRGLWTSPDGRHFLLALDSLNESMFGATRGLTVLQDGRFSLSEPLLGYPFSRAGRWGLALSAGRDRGPAVISLDSGTRMPLPVGAASALFTSPDDRRIVVAYNRQVQVWNVDPSGQTPPTNVDQTLDETVIDGHFYRNSQAFILIGQRGAVNVINPDPSRNRTLEAIRTERDLVRGFVFTDTLSHAATIDNERLMVLHLGSGRESHSINGVCRGTPTQMRVGPSGPESVVIDCADTNLPVVRTWDLDRSVMVAETPWDTRTIGARAMADDGRILVGSASLVMRREANTLSPVFQLAQDNAPRNGRVHRLAISPDGQMVASYGSDQFLRVWGADGQELAGVSVGASAIELLSFASDNRLVLATGDGAIRAWSIGAERLNEIGVARHSNLSVANMSPNGQALVTGSPNGEVCVWQISELASATPGENGQCGATARFELPAQQPVEVVGLLDNGDVVAVGQRGAMARRASSGGPRVSQHGDRDDVVIGGAVSPSGRVLLARLNGAAVSNPETGQDVRVPSLVRRLPAPRFVAGGRMVLAPVADGSVHLLDIQSGGLVAVLGRSGPESPRIVHETGGDQVMLIYGSHVMIEQVGGIPLDRAPEGRHLVEPERARELLAQYLGADGQR